MEVVFLLATLKKLIKTCSDRNDYQTVTNGNKGLDKIGRAMYLKKKKYTFLKFS